MSNLKIVFLDEAALGKDVCLDPIKAKGEYTSYENTPEEKIIERIAGQDVVISNKVYIGKKEIDSCPSLKLICIAATGMNNVDTKYAASRGIPVRNVVNYSTESVAQTTFMQMLNLVGNADYFDRYVKNGEYTASGCFTNVITPFMELKGKKYGVVGLGNIGRRVAEIASAFGMEVVYYPTSGKAHDDIFKAETDLGRFLGQCDIISVHCPLNERTDGLIGYKELSMMKESAYIINMARGGIIKETDLAQALDEGLLKGAAVDVFTQEPMSADHPYLNMKHPERIKLTPHIAWASKEARELLVKKIADNIVLQNI